MNVEQLKNRVEQASVHHVAAELHLAVAEAIDGPVCQAVETQVALLVQRNVPRISPTRVGSELCLGEIPWQLGVRIACAEKPARLEVLGRSIAEVPGKPGCRRLRVPAVTVLLVSGCAQRQVRAFADSAHLRLQATKAEAAQLRSPLDAEAPLAPRQVEARGRHDVDGAAQRGGPVSKRVGAPLDHEVPTQERVGGLEVCAAVGLVQRHSVLQQLDAPQMEGPLHARAANGQSRLVLPEPGLHEDSGRLAERVGEVADLAIGLGTHVGDGSAARDAINDGRGRFDAGDRQCRRCVPSAAHDDVGKGLSFSRARGNDRSQCCNAKSCSQGAS